MEPTDPRPRGRFARWADPNADSPWAALVICTVVWAALTVTWILYLVLADVPGYRRVLYPVLALVGLLQVFAYSREIGRKRRKESPGQAS